MIFMVVEHFRERNAKAVYERFLKEGRLAPEGLEYKGSWIEANFDRCFQLVECRDASLLQQWALRWHDLVEFEFIPVTPSEQTVETIKPFLRESSTRA
jgi:hypothetical protein